MHYKTVVRTFQLNSPYHNRLKIVFNATMLTDDGGDNLVNLITGDGIVVFDGNDTTTSPFGCGIASSSRPDNLTTLWSGSCLEYFDEAELAKMAHNHSLTVTVKLQIVYANYSQIVAKGKGCQAGRLNAFNRPQFTTRKNDNDEGFRDSRGKLHAKVLSFVLNVLHANLKDGIQSEKLCCLFTFSGPDASG